MEQRRRATSALSVISYTLLWQGAFEVKHRTVEYDVREVQPGLWRWSIYPGNQLVQGTSIYRTRERAVAACLAEINDGIERTQRPILLA